MEEKNRTEVSEPSVQESGDIPGWEKVTSDISNLMKECFALKDKLRIQEEQSRKLTRRLLLDQIEIMDVCTRLVQNMEEKSGDMDKQTKIWFGNVRSVYKLMQIKLHEAGVAAIDAPDRRPVPGLHLVEETQSGTGFEEGIIIKELEKGYLLHGELLRPAKVVVSKN